jgi:uncharacterized membrane protein YphA (DoxX/SURF4 family)
LFASAHSTDLGTLLLRLVLGSFFVLARFRFFYDPSKPYGAQWLNRERVSHLSAKLRSCGYCNSCLACFVACVEVGGGFALIFGLLTMLATIGLLVVLILATLCTAQTKVGEQCPVDGLDCCSCYLWRVEGVYIVIGLALLLFGPGAYSLDAMLFA